MVDLRRGTRAAVLEEDGPEVVAEGVERRSQDAEVGGDAGNGHGIDPAQHQGHVQIGLEKGAEAALGQKDVFGGLIQVFQHFGPRSAPQGMGLHPALKNKIALQKAVAGQDDRGAFGSGGSQQMVHGPGIDGGDLADCDRNWGGGLGTGLIVVPLAEIAAPHGGGAELDFMSADRQDDGIVAVGIAQAINGRSGGRKVEFKKRNWFPAFAGKTSGI